MKNIFGIFRSDFRRLSGSVISTVVIMGLCLVPCLYAWFNILSNWDPYGPASTSNIRVAVANEDRGTKMLGMQLNIGTLVMEGLASNDQLGWVFVDDRKQAMAGVYSGEYYAALIVPEDFTRDFVSILDGDLVHPEIEYYENEKKNAIAPKITNKAKTAVQEEINNTVVEKAAGAINSVSSVMRAFGLDADDVSTGLTNGLDNACRNLDDLVRLLSSLRNLTGEMQNLMDCTTLVVDDMGSVMMSASSTVDAANTTVVNFAGNVSGMSADAEALINKIDGHLKELADALGTGGSDELRRENLLYRLETLSTNLSALAAQAPALAAPMQNAAGFVDAAAGYADAIGDTASRDAAAQCLSEAYNCAAEAYSVQEDIDSRLSELAFRADSLYSALSDWCTVLSDENNAYLTDSAITDVSTLAAEFTAVADASADLLPELASARSAAQEILDVSGEMADPAMRDFMLSSASYICDEVNSLTAMQSNTVMSSSAAESNLTTLQALMDETAALQDKVANWLPEAEAAENVLVSIEELKSSLAELEQKYPLSAVSIEAAIRGLDELAAMIGGSSASDELSAKLNEIREAVYTAMINANTNISDVILTRTGKAEAALISVQELLSGTADQIFHVADTIGNYSKAIGSTQGTLSQSIELANSVRIYLQQLSDDIRRITTSEAFRELVEILENNPERLADYLSSPVELNTVIVYEIKDYGAAMSPYYVMLALFVGSLLTATMIKVPVKYPEYIGCSPIERYFGRKMLFTLTGLSQAVITAFGCLFYVRMQCVNPFLFVLACCIISLNFVAMNYALVYSLDNIGMAVAVIIMVIQVAGSGGSYPIDVLPEFFRKLYPLMPFHYGMDLLRETIGGLYGHTYLRCAAILLLMCVGFAIFGLLAYYPARPFNRLISKSKEKSGIM